MASGARMLLAALVAGAVACAWWVVASAPGPAGAAAPPEAAAAPEQPAQPVVTAPGSSPAGELTRAPVREAGALSAPDAPGEIEVVVIDELERPLAGARVRDLDDIQAGAWISDERGRAPLPVPAEPGADGPDERGSGARLRLIADKPGYFHAVRAPRLRPQVFLMLRRAIPLGGFVSDRDGGAPISGAQVGFQHRDCVDCEPETAFSDGSGRYRFEAVPAGARLELVTSAEGYVAERSSFRTDAEALDAAHDVALGRGLRIAVIALDAETRAPLEGAQVQGVKGPFESDAFGRVESDQLVAVDQPRGKLTVSAPGYCRLTLRPEVGALAESPELVAPLVRAVTVTGRVADASGRPVAAAELSWDAGFEWNARTAGEPLSSWLAELPKWSLGRARDGAGALFGCDAQGRFELRGAVPWTPDFTLTASAASGQFGRAALTLPGPGGSAQVLIELRSGPLAAAGATVRGRFTLNGAPERGHVYWRGATRDGGARPDRGGEFVLADVEPGPVELLVRSDRLLARSTCSLADMGPFAVYVAAGAELEHDLAIELPFATIEGRVSEASGAPAAGVTVEAADPQRCWRERARTDLEGRYRLEVPAALPAYEVTVEHAPEHLARRDVAPGSSGVDFVLARLGRLRFRALDAEDGTVITRGALDWRSAGARFRELADFGRLVPDPAGWYEVDCVAGSLDLYVSTARARHVAQQRRGVRVFPDQATEVEFLLRQSLTRRIVLDGESIELPADFAAVLLPDSLASKTRFLLEPRPHWEGLGKYGPFDELRFKPDGTARARGLKPGNYRIKVWPETLRITPERLRLKASEPEATVRVRLDWR